MILAKMILAGSLLAIVGATAPAQATPPTQQTPAAETRKGLVTVVNRLDGTIAIREEQDDKGKDKDQEDKNKNKDNKDKADAEGTTTQFKIDLKLSESVHAGDKVKFSVKDGGNPKTSTGKIITKIEVQ